MMEGGRDTTKMMLTLLLTGKGGPVRVADFLDASEKNRRVTENDEC